MKWIISVLLLISFNCNAQESANDKMEQKTFEAIAKFYKLDIIGQEAIRRVQEQYLPKQLKHYVPYFMTWVIMIKDQKIVYRRSF